MEKDPRYYAIKLLIEKNRIRKLKSVFKYIPKNVVSTDLGINAKQFRNRIKTPSIFTIKDIDDLAQLIDIDAKIIISLVYEASI